jgi:hypothetical protein
MGRPTQPRYRDLLPSALQEELSEDKLAEVVEELSMLAALTVQLFNGNARQAFEASERVLDEAETLAQALSIPLDKALQLARR